MSTVEKLDASSHAQRLELSTRRRVLLAELRVALQGAELEPPTLAFVAVAMRQMDYPERWALWARLLLAVEETERALPLPLQKRLMELA